MTQFLLLLLFGLAGVAVSSARIQKRVVNGNPADYVQFPYMISMRVSTSSSHTCGGSIVTPEHVVTAAHCVASSATTPVLPSARFIVTGHLSNIEGGRVTQVSEVRVHPGYDVTNQWQNDIAVLKLATPIPYTATEQPIPIATNDTGVETCVLSGWGRIHFPSMGLPSHLQWQAMDTFTTESCRDYFDASRIFESTLCAGATIGTGACNGDSGGPLVCNGELAGVVSWGSPCANGLPDAYARVYYYRDWLLENIADLSPLGKMYAAEALAAKNASK